MHTPETERERVTANVVKRVKQLGITYPILVDQEHENWSRWQVEAWPTIYLVDKQGRIRYRWVGELNYTTWKVMRINRQDAKIAKKKIGRRPRERMESQHF